MLILGVDHFLLMGGFTWNSFHPDLAEVLVTVKHMQTEGKLFIRIHKSATMGDLVQTWSRLGDGISVAVRWVEFRHQLLHVIWGCQYDMMGCHHPRRNQLVGTNEPKLARWSRS